MMKFGTARSCLIFMCLCWSAACLSATHPTTALVSIDERHGLPAVLMGGHNGFSGEWAFWGPRWKWGGVAQQAVQPTNEGYLFGGKATALALAGTGTANPEYNRLTVKLRVANKVGVLKKSSASLVGPCVQFLI